MDYYRNVSALYLSYYVLSSVPSTQLKLQKLVYYCEAWHLAYLEHPLIDEDFEAWIHGPAVRSLWDHYKTNGMYANLFLTPESTTKIKDYFNRVLQPEQVELIGDVLKEYGDKSAYHLESLTHSELPWREARNGYGQNQRSESVISKKTMKEYYQSLFPK